MTLCYHLPVVLMDRDHTFLDQGTPREEGPETAERVEDVNFLSCFRILSAPVGSPAFLVGNVLAHGTPKCLIVEDLTETMCRLD